jgi:thiamine transporter
MEFKLFSKLASLEGIELYMLLGGLVILGLLIWAVVASAKRAKVQAAAPEATAGKPSRTQILVYGALSITLAFVLSYFKLFSLPLGGTITLLSMLPIFAYAAYFGPAYGFTAAFAFSLLQVIQGAYIVHPVQFVLDYFVAFTLLGTASFFPKNLPLGAAVAGFLRMMASTVSGAVFFQDVGMEYGFANPWVYSLIYNFLTIGVDTILCVVVAALPPVQRLFKRVFSKS